MTFHQFKNITGGIKAVTTAKEAGFEIVNVDPGQTSPALLVDDADIKFYKDQKWFEVTSAKEGDGQPGFVKIAEDGSREQSSAIIEGNEIKPATPADIALATAQRADEAGEVITDDFSGLEDADLRAFLKDRDGRSPHPNTSREKLLAQARAGGISEDEEEGV